MAAIPITIVGIETRDDGSSGNVTIVGMASITGLGVGGGPIIPPAGPPPHPEHPIAGWPGSGFPDKPGYPPTVEHPIVLPPEGGGGQPPPNGGNGGGTPIPPEEMPPPPPPPEQYAQQMVVQVWHPSSQSWTTKAYDEFPSQWPSQPQSGGQQRQRR